MRSVLVAGLDVGSACTRAVIGELQRGHYHPALGVLGVGRSRTVGVRRDVVTDLEAATECIRATLREAEVMAGVRIDRVYLGVSGDHVAVDSSSGVVAVAAEEIVQRDVARVHEVAQAVALPRDRELLHAVPCDYHVDYHGGITDPVGMSGTRLETELYLVTGSSVVVGNLTRAVEKAGYRVQGRVFEPLAAARAVLAEDEKELGVAMVDLGGASTGITIHYEGKIRDLGVLPFGGSTITGDLIRGLSIPFADAHRVKEQHGSACARLVDPADVVRLPGVNGRGRSVPRSSVAELIEQRLESMFRSINRRMHETLPKAELGAGIVLTGGVAATPGICEMASEYLSAPVRTGFPAECLAGLAEMIARPGFATAAGLALHGADCFMETGEGASTVTSGLVTRVGAWLREFF